MRKILYTTLALLVFCSVAVAQERNRSISIEEISIGTTNETLDIDFTIKASRLELKSDGQLKLEFAVENIERKLVLPVIVYAGTQRYYYEQRRAELSGNYYIEPYKIYKGVRKNQMYELKYKMSIPYHTWMEHASITYAEYLRNCKGDYRISNGVLVADLNPIIHTEPEIWRPDSTLYPNIVSFLMPKVEEVKKRASMVELRIAFPVNVTEVHPEFGSNRHELNKADSLINAITNNELLTINGIKIEGYASPEGRYANNERLAKGRSESFKSYLIREYPQSEHLRNSTTAWTAEDWDGLGKLVQASNMPYKDEVLAVVQDDSMLPDSKEQVLQKIGRWSDVYKLMLNEMFPKLRRIALKVDYTVDKLDDNKARELLYSDPDLLSLDEIYRVARYYEPGSKQYREVYEIAARQYPDEFVANNNAAAAFLQEGKAEAALPYLRKIKGDEGSYINLGAYYYISGDLKEAVKYFKKAMEAGNEQGEQNLQLIKAEQYKE